MVCFASFKSRCGSGMLSSFTVDHFACDEFGLCSPGGFEPFQPRQLVLPEQIQKPFASSAKRSCRPQFFNGLFVGADRFVNYAAM